MAYIPFKLNVVVSFPPTAPFQNVRQSVLNCWQQLENTHQPISLPADHNIRDVSYTTDEKAVSALIKDCDLFICAVSGYYVKCLLELGQAKALDKSIILLVENQLPVYFDLTETTYVTYDQDNTNGHWLGHFLNVFARTIAELSFKSTNSIPPIPADKKLTEIFVSYSHRDGPYLDRLLVHLKPLERSGVLKVWSDRQIQSGEHWIEKITAALDRAAISILLISADFLASDFIINNELPPLLKNAAEKGTQIIPVIVKPCGFLRDKNIRQFQAQNEPLLPLSDCTESEQERVYETLAERIERALGSN